MAEFALAGCAPDSLMSYLKALGVLRIVSEQLPNVAVRGGWRDGVFVLRATEFDTEQLTHFFLNDYRPAPLVAPWGARSGFYAGGSESSAREALDSIVEADGERFRPFREAIQSVRTLLASLGISEKAKDDAKLGLLLACRTNLPESVLPWLDACYVLTSDDRKFPPILGTGGNEGSGSYVSGFAQQVVECLADRKQDKALSTSLFGGSQNGIGGGQASGHFIPSTAGGPNAGQGFSAWPKTNGWDYLFCLEGTLVLAGSVARRMGAGQLDRAVFPFTVRASPVGFNSASEVEASEARGEIWLPIWRSFCSLAEVSNMFAEGRAELAGKQARNGVDFARAIASLGVDRGIQEFARFAFLKRSGLNYLTASLGTFHVTSREHVGLLTDTDRWLDTFRSACGKSEAPARFKSALRRIESAIFNYSRHGTKDLFAATLRAFGAAERALAGSEKFRSDERRPIRPLSGLRTEWLIAADDGSREFRLALSLAGAIDPKGRIGSLRTNLEPVEQTKHSVVWADRSPSVVWQSGDLPSNLAAVLRRRMIDAKSEGIGQLPVQNRPAPASLGAVAAFLANDVDDEKIEELLWGMVAVTPGTLELSAKSDASSNAVPRAYALLKQLFLPHAIDHQGESVAVRAEPEIVRLLRRGDVAEACKIAMRRLRASGFEALPHRQTGRANRDEEWQDSNYSVNPQRLAAALIFPIRQKAAADLLNMITRQPDDREEASEPEPEGAVAP